MEVKEEVSDTDSGIILHSGPDSPTTAMKDVNTHTRAVKLKHQFLQDRLELCLLELKKLCIREAELTGHLSSDYPLLPGEKPPHIRQRIGAAFKLDELSILHGAQDSEMYSVEAKLALQQQIYVAASRLSHEEHLSKGVKRSRLQQCKREEKKLKELQEAVFQLRLEHGRSSPRPGMLVQRDQGTSDDSSLSDSALLDEEEMTSQSSQLSSEPPPPADPLPPPSGSLHPGPSPSVGPFQQLLELGPHQPPPLTLEALTPCHSPVVEPSPIQNTPWTETSLDQPYQKTKRSGSSKSSSSPALTPVLPPLEACVGEGGIPLQLPTHLTLRHTQSCSAPTTPEMHLRRGLSLRIPSSEPSCQQDQDRGRSRVRRRLTDLAVSSPEYSPHRLTVGNPLYHSSSEDSSSEHSAPSYAGSPCQEYPAELQRPGHPLYAYHYASHPDGLVPLPHGPPAFYRNPQPQSSPSFYRGFVDEGRGFPVDLPVRMPYATQPHPPPCPESRYQPWHGGVPPHAQRMPVPVPPHVRLCRAPSLREYPHHSSRGLPRQMVSEELKHWHQRNQFRGPRPRSLDRHRQGALRVRSVTGRESPLTRQRNQPDQQVPQTRTNQRTTEGGPVQWFAEDNTEIVSQV